MISFPKLYSVENLRITFILLITIIKYGIKRFTVKIHNKAKDYDCYSIIQI